MVGTVNQNWKTQNLRPFINTELLLVSEKLFGCLIVVCDDVGIEISEELPEAVCVQLLSQS